jgi:hypothetical protein
MSTVTDGMDGFAVTNPVGVAGKEKDAPGILTAARLHPVSTTQARRETIANSKE